MSKKLTPEEEAEAQAFIDDELVDGKEWVKHMHEVTKDHKRTAKELRDLEKFQRKVEKGDIKTRKRDAEGEWQEAVADMAEVAQITKLDRHWTAEILTDVLAGLRCRADLHLFSDDFGVDDDNA